MTKRLFFKVSTLIGLLSLAIGCQNRALFENRFSSSADTLLIKTRKVKGSGPFQLGVSDIAFRDTATFSDPVRYPKNIRQLQRFELKADFKETKNHCVEILRGNIDSKPIFIVDENNNKDLTDDPIRSYGPIDWSKSARLIKCKYLISDGSATIKDSSWLHIGDANGNFCVGKREFLIAEVEIGKKKYEFGIAEPRNPLSFAYGFLPQISILSESRKTKDSISEADLITIGEALHVNGQYYRFEKISNTGNVLTLVKEKNFGQKIGTQIGMLAPEFNVVTTSGDTVSSAAIPNKLIVVANSCGCGGDKKSTKAFYEMEREFGHQATFLHVDSDFKHTDVGTHIDSQKDFNKDFYANYRKEYCSRLCYVIGKDRRIVGKFDISRWRLSIPRLVE